MKACEAALAHLSLLGLCSIMRVILILFWSVPASLRQHRLRELVKEEFTRAAAQASLRAATR